MNELLSFLTANTANQIPQFGNFSSGQKTASTGTGFAEELARQKSFHKSSRSETVSAPTSSETTEPTETVSPKDEISSEAEAAAAAQAAAGNTVQEDTPPIDTTVEDAGAEALTDVDAVVESEETVATEPEAPSFVAEPEPDFETAATETTSATENITYNTTAPEPTDTLVDLRNAARALADILRKLGIQLPDNGEVDDSQLPAFVEFMLDKISTAMQDGGNENLLRVTLFDLQQIDMKLDLPLNMNMMPNTVYTGDFLLEALQSRLGELQKQLADVNIDAEPLNLESIAVSTVEEPELPVIDDADLTLGDDTDVDSTETVHHQDATVEADEEEPADGSDASEDDGQSDLSQLASLHQTRNQATSSVTETQSDFGRFTQEQVEPKQVIDQVVQAAALNRSAGNTRMEIQLSPEFLGKVSVILTQTKDGLVAQIRTNGDTAHQLLTSHMSELESSLKDMGINMKKVEVTQSDISWDFSRSSGDQTQRQAAQQSQSELHERQMRMARFGNRTLSNNELSSLSQAIYSAQTLRSDATSAYLGLDASVEFRA